MPFPNKQIPVAYTTRPCSPGPGPVYHEPVPSYRDVCISLPYVIIQHRHITRAYCDLGGLPCTCTPARRYFFVSLLRVEPRLGPRHLLTAARAAAAVQDPAAALCCLGWLGWSLEERDSDTGLGDRAEQDRARSDWDGSGSGRVDGEEVEEMVRALRTEALLPTAAGAWVSAAGAVASGVQGAAAHVTRQHVFVYDGLVACDSEAGLDSQPQQRFAASAASGGVQGALAAGAGEGSGARWTLSEPRQLLLGLQRAAEGADVALHVVALPLLSASGRSCDPDMDARVRHHQQQLQQLQQQQQGRPEHQEAGGEDEAEGEQLLGPVGGWACADGLRHLLCELIHMPLLGAAVEPRVVLLTGQQAAAADERPLCMQLPPGGDTWHPQQQQQQRQGTCLAEAARKVLGSLRQLSPYLLRWLAAEGVSIAEAATAAAALRVVAVGGGPAGGEGRGDNGDDGGVGLTWRLWLGDTGGGGEVALETEVRPILGTA